jgi:hypothetical protein
MMLTGKDSQMANEGQPKMSEKLSVSMKMNNPVQTFT